MRLSLKRQARYQPRSPRVGLGFECTLVLASDQVVAAAIENMSANGFMARCHAALLPDTWLGVALPGCGIVRARVRWCEAGEVGCQFRKAIDLERLLTSLADQRSRRENRDAPPTWAARPFA